MAKAITWRIFASLITFVIGWGVTGDMSFGITIGSFDVVLKLVFYYLHERLWYHSKFGVVSEEEQLQDKKNTINKTVKKL